MFRLLVACKGVRSQINPFLEIMGITELLNMKQSSLEETKGLNSTCTFVLQNVGLTWGYNIKKKIKELP